LSAIPSPGKHQNIVKIVKNKKITLFPQPVTYRGKLAPISPYENETNVPEKPYMRGNAPIYTQCTWYMLGTNADTRMASQEAVQDQNKQKCCIFCVFVTVFFSVSKSGNMNNWHIPEWFVGPRGPEMSTNRL